MVDVTPSSVASFSSTEDTTTVPRPRTDPRGSPDQGLAHSPKSRQDPIISDINNMIICNLCVYIYIYMFGENVFQDPCRSPS